MGNIISIIKCYICKLVERPRKNYKNEFSLEEIRVEEPPRVTENVAESEEKVNKIVAAEKDREEEVNKIVAAEKDREEEVIKIVVAEAERWINHCSSCQKMLLVGEGDFSFSACLGKAFGSASNMIATSLDSIEFLRENYRWAMSNIEDLQSRGCRVVHGLDATVMANNPALKGVKFDRIIYNFPHSGFFKRESRESQIRRHQRLVSLFLKNAKEMIGEEGEIHITHKTNGFHCEWNIELLASHWGLKLREALHFNHKDFPSYRTKYGFGGDSVFNCNPSKTYKFGLLDCKMI